MRPEHLSLVADPSLPFVTCDSPLHRIGRKPDAWRPPDWAYVNDDKTFGNRFDDPEGYFRVLYASSTRLGCFIETLARFRKAPASTDLAQSLHEISNATSDFTAPNTLPGSWLSKRVMGFAARIGGKYAPIYSAEWLSYLRRKFERELISSGLVEPGKADFDLHLLMSQNRSLTQRAANVIYRMGYNGVCYQSRHGTDLMNWALFEPFQIDQIENSSLGLADQDLMEAVKRLDLHLDPQI